ncbi:hypothetical protein X777_16108 [Ooceraea biroi]|uniref:Uncharacterized protein n=1 Tax=Ooceraea biroi TaxID=2015173 RepID=A0A026WV27_OOCBI|nr:hypothetical protein X777_16108 [Ooceraea biroi]
MYDERRLHEVFQKWSRRGTSSSIPFQAPPVRHHSSTRTISVKNSAIKSEKTRPGDTLSPNIGCPFIKRRKFDPR